MTSKSAISRRSFVAASTALGAVAAMSAGTPAWAADANGPLVAGSLASGESATSSISDSEIEAIIDSLPGSAPGTAADTIMAAQASSGAQQATTTEYAGATMFETAIAQAKAAFPNGSEQAVLVGPGDAWIDALSASSLAASIGPILFTLKEGLHDATKQALADLEVKKVFLIGGEAAIAKQVETDLEAAGVSQVERLWGAKYFDTQLAIFNYGIDHSLWDKDLIVLATGSAFGDALSASPIAYATKAPIFVTGPGNELTDGQKEAWRKAANDGFGKQVVIVGGPAAISDSARSFASQMQMQAAAKGAGEPAWLWGPTQYETSAEIAKWGVDHQEFSWNDLAFTTGLAPWDALAGSVLQGKDRSVLLLADDPGQATISKASEYKSGIKSVRFFGGADALPVNVRTAVTSLLSDRVKSEATGISYDRMRSLEVSASQGYQNYSSSEIDESMNPARFGFGDAEYYQFAVVNGGFSGMVTAAQLDSFIATNGVGGQLEGRGQDFIDAAQSYGTNEVYLLAHAILESGWGKSRLAMGTEVNGTTYYNFFGIGAYDSDPLGGGASTAGSNGWNTQRNAIVGAALWIRDNYHSNKYGQNTLYKMKWNYPQAASEGQVWKQYATGRTWATGIANVMDRCYKHCGLSMETCGLAFSIPSYS